MARDWRHENNLAVVDGGRILILWDEDELDVQVLLKIDQLIYREFRGKGGNWCCLLSVVYASNTPEGRMSLWESFSS